MVIKWMKIEMLLIDGVVDVTHLSRSSMISVQSVKRTQQLVQFSQQEGQALVMIDAWLAFSSNCALDSLGLRGCTYGY